MGMELFRYLWCIFAFAFRRSFGRADTISGFIPAIAYAIGIWLKAEAIVGINLWWLPLIVLGVIFAVRLLLAPYWLYKGEVAEKKKLESRLQNAEWDNEQTWRREDISGQQYPNKIPSILNDMRICLMNLMDKASSNEVTIKQLWLPLHLTPEEFAEALRQKSYDENTEVLYKWHGRMNKGGIGLMELKDERWNNLNSELEYIKKDIPDQDLKDYIRQHIYALKGYHARMLYHNYCIKTSTKDAGELPQLLRSFFALDGLLDFTLARVTNRILKLRSGVEPK